MTSVPPPGPSLRVPDPVWSDAASDPAVRLRAVPHAALVALASGDLATAAHLLGIPLDPYLVTDGCRSTWRLRAEQVLSRPEDAAWVTRVAVLDGAGVAMAGFHGRPDERGMVEVGYSVTPALRRRGVARALLRLMRTVAEADDGVRVLRATVSPGNVASRALIESEGLVEVGEQWDEEDGLEIVYETSTWPRPGAHDHPGGTL